jgi:xanthine dehydrogenase YagR molybdenum-binding subunit
MNTAVNRKDGRAKVTGTATYSAEYPVKDLIYGHLVTATIAKGSIRSIDTSAAEKAVGVVAVYTHQNAPQAFKPANNFANSKLYESRLPLSDNKIHYAGQIVAFVVADSFERARDAAHLVKVSYSVETPIVDKKDVTFSAESPMFFGEEMKFSQGDLNAGMAKAVAKVEATYTTEMELHAPMEPHAVIAAWQGRDAVTIYEHSQWVALSQRTYAELLGLPPEKVRIISAYIGGGFGSKAFPWSHSILCALAARKLGRPVKVAIGRRQMGANVGHRSETEQTLRLGATKDGTLSAISHLAKTITSPIEVFPEPCILITPVMYATPNLQIQQNLGVMNVGVPTFMRAPGECPGMWALESAMDELAWELGMDPIALRLKNETKVHQRKNLPFSEKYFADCLQVGAKQFGWGDRPQQVRSTVKDGRLIGWGVAAATFPGYRGRATAKVRLLPNGTVQVLTAGNDMGTGCYTVLAMTAAQTLGVPVEKVRVELGDSLFPDGGIAGGSQMTATITPAIVNACTEVLKVANAKTVNEAFDTLRKTGRSAFEASGSAAQGDETKKFAFNSWGAHFCEVAIDEAIGRLQITRWLSVMNIGRVINAKTAASQVRGGVIMGIGQALMEECLLDPNSGLPVIYDLATYHFPSHADIPRIEVAFVGKPDLNFNPMGVRGVGEIGITGVAAAVANAIYHATGKRLRSLPITPDKLLG